MFTGPAHQSKVCKGPGHGLGCDNESLGGYFILAYLQHLPQVLILYFLDTISRARLSIRFFHTLPNFPVEQGCDPHTGTGGALFLIQVLGVTHAHCSGADPSRRLTNVFPHHLDHQSPASIPQCLVTKRRDSSLNDPSAKDCQYLNLTFSAATHPHTLLKLELMIQTPHPSQSRAPGNCCSFSGHR